MSLGKIDNVRFCDIQGGLNDINRSVIYKKYANMEKTYSEWYEFLKDDFDLGDKRNITESKKEDKEEAETKEKPAKK